MPTFAPRPPSSRLARTLASAALLAALALPGAARADCNADFGKLMSRRMAEVSALNSNSKNNGGQLNPASACPRLRSLAAIEGELVSYMQKNKDWCNMPDELVEKMTASRAKTAGFAAKACSFAAKMKQMQQEQATQQAAQQQQQAVKLPAGPL